MVELCQLFAEQGCTNTRSYIQSGNVIFESRRSARHLEPILTRQIAERFGCTVPLVFRSESEWLNLLTRNPLADRTTAEDRLHVYFLRDVPNPQQVARLEPARILPDEFVLDGADLFLFTPNGLGKTKLTNAYVDSRLDTVSTARNWRTIRKIAELLSA